MNNWYLTDVLLADRGQRHAAAAERRRLVRPAGRIHRAVASITALPSVRRAVPAEAPRAA